MVVRPDLAEVTIDGLESHLETGEFSATDLVRVYLNHISGCVGTLKVGSGS